MDHTLLVGGLKCLCYVRCDPDSFVRHSVKEEDIVVEPVRDLMP